jgi:acyl-CoA synthetase (NDP forming)
MSKFNKDFIQDKEVLFVGYSSKNNAYSKEIFTAFSDHGIKVYPYNTRTDGNFDMKVYHKLEELPSMPKTAFVLLNKDNTSNAVKELVNHGIKRILFRSKSGVDEATLAECQKAGVETAFGCPMMVYGTGFHKFHAFFAGVK